MAEIRRDPTAGFRIGFAGDTFNTAVYCAREFGSSARIGYCTRIGRDSPVPGLPERGEGRRNRCFASRCGSGANHRHLRRVDRQHRRTQLLLLARQLRGTQSVRIRRNPCFPAGGKRRLSFGHNAGHPAPLGPRAPHRAFARPARARRVPCPPSIQLPAAALGGCRGRAPFGSAKCGRMPTCALPPLDERLALFGSFSSGEEA